MRSIRRAILGVSVIGQTVATSCTVSFGVAEEMKVPMSKRRRRRSSAIKMVSQNENTPEEGGLSSFLTLSKISLFHSNNVPKDSSTSHQTRCCDGVAELLPFSPPDRCGHVSSSSFTKIPDVGDDSRIDSMMVVKIADLSALLLAIE